MSSNDSKKTKPQKSVDLPKYPTITTEFVSTDQKEYAPPAYTDTLDISTPPSLYPLEKPFSSPPPPPQSTNIDRSKSTPFDISQQQKQHQQQQQQENQHVSSKKMKSKLQTIQKGKPKEDKTEPLHDIEYHRSSTGTFIWFSICLLQLYQIMNCPNDKSYQKSISVFFFMKSFSICWFQSSSSTMLYRHFVGTALLISPLLLGEYRQVWTIPIALISLSLFFKLNHPIARYLTPLWTNNTDKELLEVEFGEREENLIFNTKRSCLGTVVYCYLLLSLGTSLLSIYLDRMEMIEEQYIRIFLTIVAGTFTLSSIASPRITICRPRIRYCYLGFFWMLFLQTVDIYKNDLLEELLVVYLLLSSLLPVIIGLMNKPTDKISRILAPFYVAVERKNDLEQN